MEDYKMIKDQKVSGKMNPPESHHVLMINTRPELSEKHNKIIIDHRYELKHTKDYKQPNIVSKEESLIPVPHNIPNKVADIDAVSSATEQSDTQNTEICSSDDIGYDASSEESSGTDTCSLIFSSGSSTSSETDSDDSGDNKEGDGADCMFAWQWHGNRIVPDLLKLHEVDYFYDEMGTSPYTTTEQETSDEDDYVSSSREFLPRDKNTPTKSSVASLRTPLPRYLPTPTSTSKKRTFLPHSLPHSRSLGTRPAISQTESLLGKLPKLTAWNKFDKESTMMEGVVYLSHTYAALNSAERKRASKNTADQIRDAKTYGSHRWVRTWSSLRYCRGAVRDLAAAEIEDVDRAHFFEGRKRVHLMSLRR